jgi:hypothetical protein
MWTIKKKLKQHGPNLRLKSNPFSFLMFKGHEKL